ncbi:MAG: CotH kinase family protein [Eubacteriales bacterium]|nr:CotH kinase family protein [Eubacteriales bacterium]
MKKLKRNKIFCTIPYAAMLLLFSCILFFSGCAVDSESQTLVSPDETYEKASMSADNYKLKDKASLYKDSNDSEVITMYLTVGRGNEDDGTDHTWTEVNEYPLSYYKDKGIEPYKCEAVLQIGDDTGPVEDEFGYGETAANASVQLRGEGASAQYQKSYRINIKDGKGRWEKQKAVVLNKHAGDPLRFTNKLAYSLMQEIPQMVSVRTRFVHLYVKDKTEGENGLYKDYGLYTQVEQINKTYLKNHDFDKDGQLYKAENFDWQRHPDSIRLATSPEFSQKEFEELLEIKGSDDHTKLLEMLDAVNDEGQPVSEVIGKYFDKDNLYYWLAFQMLTGNKDAARGNYYLYSPQAVTKWFFISWDNDNAFSDIYEKLRDEFYSNSWNTGIFTYTGSKLYERIFRDEQCREEFAQVVEDLKNNYLTREMIGGKASEYQDTVKKYLYQMPDQMYARVTPDDYDYIVEHLYGEVEENYGEFKDSLDQPWPFHILEPEKKDDSLVIQWENAYIFEGKVTYTVELGDTYNFEKPIVYEEGVAQASLTTDMLPAGQYFLRVQAKSESGLSQDAYEYYHTEHGTTVDSTMCFYVQEDGSVDVSVYYEEER